MGAEKSQFTGLTNLFLNLIQFLVNFPNFRVTRLQNILFSLLFLSNPPKTHPCSIVWPLMGQNYLFKMWLKDQLWPNHHLHACDHAGSRLCCGPNKAETLYF